jgi:hypothetical protein
LCAQTGKHIFKKTGHVQTRRSLLAPGSNDARTGGEIKVFDLALRADGSVERAGLLQCIHWQQSKLRLLAP